MAHSYSSCAVARRTKHCRAIIVHPDYRWQLVEPPECPQPPVGWADLPEECQALVIFKLEAADVCSMARVNRAAKQVCHQQRIWQELCFRQFGVLPERSPPCWRELYEFNVRLFLEICRQAPAAAAVAQMPPLHLAGFAQAF